jgi:hypothetical protein
VARRRWGLVIGLGLAALLVAGRLVTGWIVDYQWFRALGAVDVFWARTYNLTLLRAGAFAVAFLLVFSNLLGVRSSVASVILPRRMGNLEIGEELPSRYLLWVIVLLSLALGAVLALPRPDWTSLELVRTGEVFRESDPYFQQDLAFWVYWLPLEEGLHLWATVAVLAVTLVVMFLYALTPSLRWESGRLRISGHVKRHLAVLGGLFLLLLAWSYRLEAHRLLFNGSGEGGAFTAVDHRVGVPAHLVLALATVVAAMLVVWTALLGQWRASGATLVGILVLSVALRQLLPWVAPRFLSPVEQELRDRPYLSTRAAFSRRGFGVDRIVVPDSAPATVWPRTAGGVPTWDAEALRRAAEYLRLGGRPTGSLGWVQYAGHPLALFVEQPQGPASLDALAPWSLTLLHASRSGESGTPIRGNDVGEQSRPIPAVVVGDSARGLVVAFDSLHSVAAPALDRWSKRLTHAWGLQNPRLLQKAPGTVPGSVIRVRDVRERVEKLFPFFMQGSHVSPVVAADSLLWTVPVYAASLHYPLTDAIATPGGDVTYFQPAGIAVVNAHTGRAIVIRAANPDPVARSWYRRFPRMFVAPGSVREELLRQLAPASDGVLAQARVYARFGRRGESVARPMHLARETGADTLFRIPLFAPYVDSAASRLAVAYPILDADERLRGIVAATGGGSEVTRWHPLREQPRWTDVLDRLRRALDSMATASRYDEGAVTRGPVRAVVSGGTPMLVQTLYLWRPDVGPQQRFVAVHVGDSVRVGRSLYAALGIVEPTVASIPLTPEAFRARVSELHGRMTEALGRQDFGAFGEALRALGALVRSSPSAP